ncbi:uncharacterized protein F5891DRAFT_981109 [Suillus fuscotomentosus]|uniref:Uncharacterized protein n=1 Tax=Suillus fuscotomentosus TaxID=1912939 RepID=A0AAD4E4D2_9AGAM|nr:uncharacterized protein F5891DRAFT_981109 [Suillus fuscotomentosus]KAG1899330.1 hypothetical protein F5891DRAFT_981109 [Suillus fuscotomentosus]
MLPKRTTQPMEKVLAMAAEGRQAKQKAIDKPSTPMEISKCTKVIVPINIEQSNNTTTPSIYRATVQTSKEEDEAAHSHAIIIESDGFEKNDIEVDDPGESSEAELDRLKKDWTSPIYAFFKPTLEIEYQDNRHCHVFKCTALGCKQKHVKSCWGEAALQTAMEYRDTAAAQDGVVKNLLETGSIKTSFERKGKEPRVEIVCWVSESLRPFETVNDQGFQKLMKTGRLEYHIPSPSTITRDIKQVFVETRKQIARVLQMPGHHLITGLMWPSPCT